jgi:hypothetical protein
MGWGVGMSEGKHILSGIIVIKKDISGFVAVIADPV